MIPVLPVSHLIDDETLPLVPGIKALEYKTLRPLLSSRRPALFHSNLGVIESAFREEAAKIGSFCTDNNIDLASFDLGPASDTVRVDDFQYRATGKRFTKSELLDEAECSLDLFRQHYSGPVALENLNYYPTDAYETVCEPDFIAEAIEKLGIGLLLDFGHALVSAMNLQIPFDRYLDVLPLERVAEIHLSTPNAGSPCWRDAHHRPDNVIYDSFASIRHRLNDNSYIAIECYDNIDTVIDCYGELSVFLSAPRETSNVSH